MSGNEPAHGTTGRPLLHKFTERLNELIRTVYPDDSKRPGYGRLAKEISETTGGAISGTYLWELTTGRKRNVTLEQLDILAQFFGVPPEYFLNDEVFEHVREQLTLATALKDAQVRNIALRSQGLSPAALNSLLTMVNEARRMGASRDPEDTR